jgi:iron complex transport system substrate-binding protein
MKSIKNFVFLTTFIALTLLMLTACNNSQTKQAKGIIVTSPEVAEIIAELGGLDQIIARTKYCDYPEEMLEKESIGDFSNIDIERVIQLKPKIIFTAAFEQQEFYDKMKPFGIELIKIHSNSLEAYYKNVRLIAEKIGKSNRADSLINSFQQSLDSLELPTNKPKVYFEISSNLGTVTDQSFIGELIKLAGGSNIFGDINQDFFIAKNEDIVHANPDVIIALSYVSKVEILARKGWQNMSALKNNRIYTVDDIDIDTVMRTIPRSSQALKLFNSWFLDYDKK